MDSKLQQKREVNGGTPFAEARGSGAGETLYPCADCGTLRTKAEGGTTFTVCDECWEKHYAKYREGKRPNTELPRGGAKGDSMSTQPETATTRWQKRMVRRSYANEHYSSALNYGADAPPSDYICAECGETSADAGRYRKAEAWELQDEEGECYECSTCGSQMALPPPNDKLSDSRPEKPTT